MEKKILFASSNDFKIREVKQILKDYEVLSLKDVDYNDDVEETGTTFEENSIIKAKAIREYLKSKNINIPLFADDSGLCVNSLNGEPGIYTARYAGGHGNTLANRKKLLDKLNGIKDRSAYYITVITYIDTNDNIKTFEGRTYGRILEKETGDTSRFAYDCLFYSNDLEMCFAECPQEAKNSVSSRKRALESLENYLENENKF